MKLKLKFENPSSVTFTFPEIGIVITSEATEVDETYGKAILEQFPHHVQAVEQVSKKK